MTTPTDLPAQSRSAALALVLAIVLGGCSLVFPHHGDIADPANLLTDEQARAQVVEPARQIAKVANLQDVNGGFYFAPCNDQGEPPFQGRVDMTFDVPAGFDHDAYFKQIAATMVAHGWTAGPPPGLHPFGQVIHKGGVMAIIGKSGRIGADGDVQLYGECRNMTDHRKDSVAVIDITDQLRGG